MATKLDELQVELRAIDRGLQASIADVSRQISTFSKKADNDLSVVDRAFSRARGEALKYFSVWQAFNIGRGIVDAGMQMQALHNRFLAATGSAQVAADSLAYVRAESERLGLSFQTTASDFAAFSASALRSGMTLQQTKDVFNSVAEAVTALHLSPEQASSAFLALEQMASKGTVQMQELKLQLSQAIPGAFEIMAKAMNVSVAQLNKMMEQGELLSSDALPRLGEELHRQFGDVAVKAADSAQAAFNRLNNAWFDLQSEMASSGVLDTVTEGVKELTTALNDPEMIEGMKGFAQLLADIAVNAAKVASAVGGAYNSIETGSDKVFGAVFGKAGTDAIAQVRQEDAFNKKMDAANATFTDRVLADFIAKHGGSTSPEANYTLGTSGPAGETAAQAKARKAAERAQKKAQELRESMLSKVEGIDRTNAREVDPQKAAALQIKEQQDTLKQALDAKAITEDEYRQKSLEAEMAYQDRLTDIRQKATDLEVDMRDKALNNIQGLLEVFAGKNKAIAMALLVFDKARAIAQAIMETHVAAAAALKYDPTGATSAYVTTLGYANVAAIAATGIAQLATMGGGGGGGSSFSGSSGTTGAVDTSNASTAAVAPTKSVFLTLNGNDSATFTKNQVRQIIDQINDALRDGSKLDVVVTS